MATFTKKERERINAYGRKIEARQLKEIARKKAQARKKSRPKKTKASVRSDRKRVAKGLRRLVGL